MFSMLNRGAKAAVLAIALLSLGCESPTEPIQETTSLEVQAPDPFLGGLLGGIWDILRSAPRLVSTVVDIVEGLAGGIIGPLGGILEVQGHELVVPEGAVPHPALFTMVALPGRTVQVDLHALDPQSGEDVGSDGFNRPVTLSLSYRNTDISWWEARKLTIVQILDDGTRVPVPSTVNTRDKTVTAQLEHFSRYGLCRN